MGDLDDLRADLPTLQRAGGEIGDIADALAGEQHRLDQEMAGFLDGDWRGPAADAFRRHYDEWARGAAGVLAALGDEAALIAGTVRLIGEQDRRITGDIDRLVERLGLV